MLVDSCMDFGGIITPSTYTTNKQLGKNKMNVLCLHCNIMNSITQ